jgi:hypothetical protein
MTFAEWFEAQHGKRGNGTSSDKELRDMARSGRAAEEELQQREKWDNMRRAALYAWQVAEQDKAKGDV